MKSVTIAPLIFSASHTVSSHASRFHIVVSKHNHCSSSYLHLPLASFVGCPGQCVSNPQHHGGGAYLHIPSVTPFGESIYIYEE